MKPNPKSNNASKPNGQNGPGPTNARKFVMGNNENVSPNVLREFDSNRESHREKDFLGNSDSHRKPGNANGGPVNGARAQIVIPKNLNIKEEQLPFFEDLQNVLTLFSELKSRIEKVSIEKCALEKTTEALSSNYESLQREFSNQDQKIASQSTQIKNYEQEIQALASENRSLSTKQKKSEEFSEEYQNLILSQKKEIQCQKDQASQLTVDLNVLKALMKEMIVKDTRPETYSANSHSEKPTSNSHDDSFKYSANNSYSFGDGLNPNHKSRDHSPAHKNNSNINLTQSFGENIFF